MNQPEPDPQIQRPNTAQGLAPVPWKFRDVAIATAIPFSLAAAGILISQDDGGELPAIADSAVFVWLMIVAIFAFQGLPFGLAWFFAIVRRHASWSQLGIAVPGAFLGDRLERPHLSINLLLWPGVAFLCSMAFTIGYSNLVSVLGIDFLIPDQGIDAGVFGEGPRLIANFAAIGLWAPFTEEVFFRGFMLAFFVKALGVRRGTILSAALFSLGHMQIGVLIPIFVSGLLLSWLYLKTRSIWPSTIAHVAQNSFVVFATTYLPNSPSIG